jgi:hypothetical protein
MKLTLSFAITWLVSLLAANPAAMALAFRPMLTTTAVRQQIHQRSTRTMLQMAAPENQKTMEEQQRKDEVRADAESALQNTGWMMPSGSGNADADGEMTADDPFVQAINAGIQRDVGVSLEELLNPAKVVNLERDLYTLRASLAEQTNQDISEITDVPLTTEMCDGGGGGEYADSLRKSITKKEASLLIERRSVFRGWLKNVFLGQAILSFGLSYVMATDPAALFGSFGWFNEKKYNMDISIEVLGYWWWWLFVVPSLRSRRPKGFEKKALDIAFLASPAVSLVAPVFTKDTGIIWAANFIVVAASYGYAFATDDNDNDSDDDDSKTPAFVKFLYKSLDFGAGRERGARN